MTVFNTCWSKTTDNIQLEYCTVFRFRQNKDYTLILNLIKLSLPETQEKSLLFIVNVVVRQETYLFKKFFIPNIIGH